MHLSLILPNIAKMALNQNCTLLLSLNFSTACFSFKRSVNQNYSKVQKGAPPPPQLCNSAKVHFRTSKGINCNREIWTFQYIQTPNTNRSLCLFKSNGNMKCNIIYSNKFWSFFNGQSVQLCSAQISYKLWRQAMTNENRKNHYDKCLKWMSVVHVFKPFNITLR